MSWKGLPFEAQGKHGICGLLRLWQSVEESKHPRMKQIRGAPSAIQEDEIGNTKFGNPKRKLE
jgi:hypothetical protein